MDRETIIKLAHETLDRMAPDDYCREPYWTATDDELERFAKLVAEHIRAVAEDEAAWWQSEVEGYAPPAPAQDDRNKLADWMMKFAFATGHGDTIEDLLDALGTEIVDTVDAAREDEREECAKVCEEDGLLWGQRYAAAIRARKTNDQMDS